MSMTRPYRVVDKDTGAVRRVIATTQAQAIRHVVGARFTADPMTSMETARAALDGMPIEDATAKAQSDLPTRD